MRKKPRMDTDQHGFENENATWFYKTDSNKLISHSC